MRLIVWITAILAVLYSGYWFVASRATRTGIERTLVTLKDEGRADFKDVSILGFPSRFDVTIDEPRLTDPANGFTWAAPFFQILALSYRPNNIIAVWPNTQTLSFAGKAVEVASADMRASALFGASTRLPLDHVTFVGSDVRIGTAEDPVSAAVNGLRFATRLAGTDGLSHEIGFALDNAKVDATGLPPALANGTAQANLDATAQFDRPIDRMALQTAPLLEKLDLTDLQVSWGPVQLKGSGNLTVTPEGTPQGRITLTLKDWTTGIDAATALGLIEPEVAPTYKRVFDALAKGMKDQTTLTVPIDFSEGLMLVGPIPLGPAPILR